MDGTADLVEENQKEPSQSSTNVVLYDLLGNKMMLYYFQRFLEQEHSEENLLFFLEVEAFKRTQTYDMDEIEKLAMEIYKKYIDPRKAPQLVNLSEDVVSNIQTVLSKAIAKDLENSKHEHEHSDSEDEIHDKSNNSSRESFEKDKKSNVPKYGTLTRNKSYVIEQTEANNEMYNQAQIEIQTLIERDSLPRFLKKASFSGSLRKPRASAKSTLKMNFDENTISDLLDMVQAKEKCDEDEYVGTLKRKKGILSQWKGFKYVKKGNSLLEYKLEGDIKKENPLRNFRLKSAIIKPTEKVTAKDNVFSIFIPHDNRTYFFQATSPKEKINWLRTFGLNDEQISDTTSDGFEITTNSGSASGSSISLNLPKSTSSGSLNSISSTNSTTSRTSISSISSLPSLSGPNSTSLSSSSTTSSATTELRVLSHLEKFKDSVVVVNDDLKIVGINSKFLNLFNVDRDSPSLIGGRLDYYFVEPSKFQGQKLTLKMKAKRMVGGIDDPKEEIFDTSVMITKLLKGHLMIQISEIHEQNLTSKLFGRNSSSLS